MVEVYITNSSSTFHEASRLLLNCDKATQVLSLHVRWRFQQTIKGTAEWYWAFESGAEDYRLSWEQILRYMKCENRKGLTICEQLCMQ